MKRFTSHWITAFTALFLAAAAAGLAVERRLTVVEERKPDRSEVGAMIDARLDGLAKRLEDIANRLEQPLKGVHP